MGLSFDDLEGQTPLDEDEKLGLLIPTIATRGELDEFEQQNIELAIQWTLGRSLTPESIFTEKFIRMLHFRMYSKVWSWAGEFRKTNKNIGIDKWQIPVDLRQLFDDALFWHKHHSFQPDEIAVRFKHRLVSIHCFANGNGRHSRLMADIIMENVYRLPLFTWGAANLSSHGNSRETYIQAVKSADKGDYQPLLDFART